MISPLTIVIQGPPHGKGRPRFGAGHVYTPVATKNYETGVALLAKSEMRGGRMFEGPLHIDLRAVFAIPKSWHGNQRAAAIRGEIRPTVKPDADNILKAIKDALNGIAYRDDAQIVSVNVSKVYGAEPFVVATVKPVVFTQATEAQSQGEVVL